jgi:hypothetical protein
VVVKVDEGMAERRHVDAIEQDDCDSAIECVERESKAWERGRGASRELGWAQVHLI